MTDPGPGPEPVRPPLERGGVFRVLASPDTVAAELAGGGWRVAELPELTRRGDFYAALRHALDLPDWTGTNLDALWDVLTDLTEPTVLIWHRYATFAMARPEPWRRILEVLEERAALEPPFAVLLT